MLDNIGNNIKAITNSLWMWLKNVRTLSYADIVKNLVLAILILFVVYIALNMEVIASMSSLVIWGIAGVLVVFVIIQLTLEINNANKKKEHQASLEEEHRIIEGKRQIEDELDSAMDKAIYRLNCRRIMIHSYHNGIRAFAGLPFLRMSVIKEVINQDMPNVEYMADAYQNQLLSLYKFPSLLNNANYMVYSFEKMKGIDYKFACNMAMSGDKHSLAVQLRNGHNIPIGDIILSWDKEEDIPSKGDKRDCERIKEEVDNISSLAKAYLIVK